MEIHITSAEEKISDVAKKYEINEKMIRNSNELGSAEPTVGEELLIIKPTREYKVQFGDTVDRIALRFGIRKGEILQNNPWIIGRSLDPGEILMLKTSDKQYGMSAANGYYYIGCTDEKLNLALPYLTYVTFASATLDKKGISRTMQDKKVVEKVNKASKIPLIRIHSKIAHEDLSNDSNDISERIIEFAMDGEYKGVVLNACPYNNSSEEYSSFLVNLRKLMIGCDLILITEINDKSPLEFSEYSDGSVMYYPKFAERNPLDFEIGERKILTDFACNGESAKCFVDIPGLSRCGNVYSSIGEALSKARRNGCEIKHNESTLLSHFTDKKQGENCFTSMKNIKAILDIISEMGYMGVCFDIMRTPLSHYLMYNNLFKTSYHTNVRSREGCSRGVEE